MIGKKIIIESQPILVGITDLKNHWPNHRITDLRRNHQ